MHIRINRVDECVPTKKTWVHSSERIIYTRREVSETVTAFFYNRFNSKWMDELFWRFVQQHLQFSVFTHPVKISTNVWARSSDICVPRPCTTMTLTSWLFFLCQQQVDIFALYWNLSDGSWPCCSLQFWTVVTVSVGWSLADCVRSLIY